MALDEPRQDDNIIERGAYKLVLDPQVAGFIQENGGLEIDYVDEEHQKGYLVRLASADEGEGGCGGGCSC